MPVFFLWNHKRNYKIWETFESLNISEKKPMSLVFLIVQVNETKNIWSGMNTFLVPFSICYIEFW